MIDLNAKIILLVEDETIVALAQAKRLETHGFRVITAHTGEDAIRLIRENYQIDLVLMDIDLGPGIDGIRTASEILRIREVPVVFLTGRSEKVYVDRVKQITRYGYVLKSSGEFVLVESIAMAFELFEAHRLTNQSRLRYQGIFENANDAIFVESMDDRILDANRKATELMGYTREELFGMTVRDLQAPEHEGEQGQIIRSEIVAHRGRPFEALNIRKDGFRVPVEVTTAQIDDNSVISIVRDISDRKRVMDDLRAQEAEYRTLLENASDLLLQIAADVGALVAALREVSSRRDAIAGC